MLHKKPGGIFLYCGMPMRIVAVYRNFTPFRKKDQFTKHESTTVGVKFDHQITVKWLFLMGYLGTS